MYMQVVEEPFSGGVWHKIQMCEELINIALLCESPPIESDQDWTIMSSPSLCLVVKTQNKLYFATSKIDLGFYTMDWNLLKVVLFIARAHNYCIHIIKGDIYHLFWNL